MSVAKIFHHLGFLFLILFICSQEKLVSSKNRIEAALGKRLKIDVIPEVEKIHKVLCVLKSFFFSLFYMVRLTFRMGSVSFLPYHPSPLDTSNYVLFIAAASGGRLCLMIKC